VQIMDKVHVTCFTNAKGSAEHAVMCL
jgi:hypothetical protein